MNRWSLLVFAVCVSLLAAGAALAQDDPAASPRREAAFKAMDANGDGKVTKEEYLEFVKKQAEKRFDKLDAQGKGYITKDDFLAQKPRKGGKPRNAAQPQ